MGFSPGGLKGKGGAAKAEEKAEKTVFDLKLEGGFDSGAKIKIIKEVRSFTDLGLKEAKELVEKAPAVLKKGVTKEEAEKIIEKMKGVGAKITMDHPRREEWSLPSTTSERRECQGHADLRHAVGGRNKEGATNISGRAEGGGATCKADRIA
nr:50S ribosomal protein L7/L12-like [Ipomoea batatas]